MQPPQRRESQESGERVDLTGALPSPVLFWEICQKPINQKKEQHEFARVRARVYVYIYIYIYIYCIRRVNETMTHTHIYTYHVSLLYFLTECNVIYWMIIHAMDRLNLTTSFLTKPSLSNFKCYKTPQLKYVNGKSNSILAEMCTPYPTFYSIQLVAHHLLRHKGRHVGFVACCWCWLLVGTL